MSMSAATEQIIFNKMMSVNYNAAPEPNTLHIRMTRGERRIADELRKQFGDFGRVVIDVDGERHEFSADSLIRLLESYEGAHDKSRWAQLFGTPEKAARTIAKWCAENDGSCTGCPLFMYGVGIKHCEQDEDDMPSLLAWLRGESE